MADPMVFADEVRVETVREGKLDTRQFGTTALEKFFNHHTAFSASASLFHHPEDERFVPTDLPDPSPITMRMSGGSQEFTGEPYFELPSIPSEPAGAPTSATEA